MNKIQFKQIALTSAIVSALAACGGGGGDGGVAVAADTRGQVINGYITGATVTLDINDDGICDASEPQTTTDATGHYVFQGQGAHLVCATGGTNTATGLPFEGLLMAPANATVVTPLTTLIVAQAESGLPAPSLGKAAPLDPTAVAAAQTKIMAQLSLPANAPVLTTDPVAMMNRAGASTADAKLEQTNAAVQVLLQQVAHSIIASGNLPVAANTTTTNETFRAAVDGLQTALNAVGGAPVDLTTATTASTGRLITAMVTKAAATAKASKVLAAVSASFGTISPTSVAAVVAATPIPDLVNSVASATASSLTTKGGAETVALSSTTEIGTVIQQVAPLLTDNADAGSVSTTVLTNLTKILLPALGTPATQAEAVTAISNAVTKINASLPAGRMPVAVPPVTTPDPVTPPVTPPVMPG